MVKSSSIVAARDRSEVLSPRLKGKLERYVAYWRKQSRGKWPVRAVAAENIGAAPQPEATALERALDRVRYTLLRTADRTVPFAYAILSTQVWQEYRQMKSHRRRVILKAANS
jgi:hypothetical protein